MSIDNQIEILKEEVYAPKLAIAGIVILVVSVVAMVIFMMSKPGTSQEVVTGQELIIGVDSATLYIPKNAITKAGVINILSLASNLYPDASDWFRSQVVSVEYLDADGTPYLNVTFSEPALICFQLAKKQWPHYIQNPDEYQVQYYDEEQSPPVWVALPLSTYPDRYELCGQTDHLSVFALAVKPQLIEEIPVTGSSLTPQPTGSLSPTPIGTFNQVLSPTPFNNNNVRATPVSTQAALTATSIALTATDVPSPTATNVPPPTATNVPPPTATNVPPPTATDVPPPTATDVPPDTPEPPPDTPEPPPDTPEPPPDTPEPPPLTVEQ